MVEPATEKKLSLTLRRTFSAPREKVFQAWTQPEALKQWWGPPGYEAVSAEVDLRVGGRYRIGMRQVPEGEVFFKTGTYREVSPPERIVCTWRWESAEMDFGETLLTLQFRDAGEETEIVLTHELFPGVEVRDQHFQGWNGCFESLSEFLNR